MAISFLIGSSKPTLELTLLDDFEELFEELDNTEDFAELDIADEIEDEDFEELDRAIGCEELDTVEDFDEIKITDDIEELAISAEELTELLFMLDVVLDELLTLDSIEDFMLDEL